MLRLKYEEKQRDRTKERKQQQRLWLSNQLKKWTLFFDVLFWKCNLWYLYTWSKNDVILSVRNHYCALGLGLELALG